MANDIIGTPVERVIPEGWHVLRNGDVAMGDACTGDYWWNAVGPGMSGKATDCNGFCFDNGVHLVIRRNAPGPSVEKLRRDRDDWKALTELQEVTVNNLKAKVAELEAENVRLGGLTGVVHDQEETVRWHRLRHLESTRQIDSLKAKVAELETALDAERASYSAKDAEVDRLKAEAEQLKRDLKASDARYCQQFQDVGRMCDKLNAIRKVMEGA